MVAPRHLVIKGGDQLLSAGTRKGTFVLRGRASSGWRGGHHFAGHAVCAMAYDGWAHRRRLGVGPESAHWGAASRSCDDFGQTWRRRVARVRLPDDTGLALQKIWQRCPRIRSRRAARRS